MIITTQQLELIDTIDKDYEANQTKIMELFGDPGHDIGDASTALEILANVANEHDHEDFTDILIQLFPSHKKEPILELLHYLSLTNDNDISNYHISKYGQRAWSI